MNLQGGNLLLSLPLGAAAVKLVVEIVGGDLKLEPDGVRVLDQREISCQIIIGGGVGLERKM